jgi:repressor LexA
MLSKRQQDLLNFLKKYIQRHHRAPTQREILETLKIKSCSFVNRALDKLEATGYIKRGAARSRYNIKLCTSPYTLPLLGKIAAGAPIEAIKQSEEIAIVQKLLGDNRYVLEVKGDSMIEDNICNGDWIICEKCDTAPDNTIVVALVRGEEATLKRVFREKNRIRLEPANKNYQPQYYNADEIVIQGKFIGLIRLN